MPKVEMTAERYANLFKTAGMTPSDVRDVRVAFKQDGPLVVQTKDHGWLIIVSGATAEEQSDLLGEEIGEILAQMG